MDVSKVELPRGTVTMVFTDIEGSTRLLLELGREDYVAALTEHRQLLRDCFTAHGGVEVDTQGDSFLFAFDSPQAAVTAAASGQRALAEHEWAREPIRVRMGVHTGEPLEVDGLYAGIDVHRAARIMGAGHGGQVLLSQTVREFLDESFALRDLGNHRLKDLSAPQRLYQIGEGDFPPLKSLNQTNLPIQPTAFIGREKEREELEAILRRPDVRLLTVTGPGGTGKTRLALQVAAELVDAFPDGVFFVNLAPLVDPNLVEATLALTLGLRERGDQPLSDTLREYLRERNVLLLLDNFEQVAGAAAVLGLLLAASPGLKMLVTSRIRLQLAGERTYPVPPLRTLEPNELDDLTAVRACEAVKLFLERATAVKPDFEVSQANASAVAEICARLDGLPLAIELAAARTHVLPPTALLARLDRRLDLLTGGALDADERQRTLRATIEWSHELLSSEAKRLFAVLGIFAGGCRIEAAEAILAASHIDVPDVFSALSSLVEANLSRQMEDGDGEPRFLMLETIREYARNQLSELDPLEEVARAHADFFSRVAEEADALFDGPDEAVGLARVERERENMRAALVWFQSKKLDASVLKLAASLGSFFATRGELREGYQWLEYGLTHGDGDSDTRERALRWAFWLAAYQGNITAARQHAVNRTENAKALDDAARVRAMACWAHLSEREQDYQRALELQLDALDAARQTGNKRLVSDTLSNLFPIAFGCGAYEQARAAAEEAVVIDRELDAPTALAVDLGRLGMIAVLEGRSDEGTSFYRQATPTFAAVGDRERLSLTFVGLGAAALQSGDPSRAARLAGAAEGLEEKSEFAPEGLFDDFQERFLEAPLRLYEGDAIVAASRAKGMSMSLEEAVAYAMEDPAVASKA